MREQKEYLVVNVAFDSLDIQVNFSINLGQPYLVKRFQLDVPTDGHLILPTIAKDYYGDPSRIHHFNALLFSDSVTIIGSNGRAIMVDEETLSVIKSVIAEAITNGRIGFKYEFEWQIKQFTDRFWSNS